MTNTENARHYINGTFEMLTETGESLKYKEAAKTAEGLFAKYFDVFTQDDRYLMAAIATALRLSTEEDTGILEHMSDAELKRASELIRTGAAHAK